jgi:tRNA (guanine-N7-)-methyltransferase
MLKRTVEHALAIAVDPETLADGIDFALLFGRSAPVHIEVGSGKGTFLTSQASQSPQINFFGIEWARKYCRLCVDRCAKKGLDNVRMIRADASDFLSRIIPESSVTCFHVYFPDPWPKIRHHKRRFLSPTNLPHLHRCLIEHGTIRFVTDDAKYFEDADRLFQSNIEFWDRQEFIPLPGTLEGELVGTNYERKYRVEGRPFYSLVVRKKPGPVSTGPGRGIC